MRKKLIKRFLDGGLNSFALDKSANYPNTLNAGAKKFPITTVIEGGGGGSDGSNGSGGGGRKKVTGGTGDGPSLFQRLGGWNTVNMGTSMLSSLLPQVENSSGYNTVNNVLGMAGLIPVVGKYFNILRTGMNILNSLGGTTLDSVNNDQTTLDTAANSGGGYGSVMSAWDEAKDLSGKKVGLFTSSSKLNAKIHEANRQMLALSNIIGTKKLQDILTGQMGDIWNQRTMNELNGGFGNISFGRLGLKVEILDKVHSILNKPKVVDTLTEFKEEVPEFKDGGKMNVIPEGSLHARLHHMENAEGLTKKGIPVVSIAEGGQMELQAEIELNEIIFRLEVTQELEKLMEDGSDNAAIEAGKLLVKEIFENTDDRTGLLKSLEPEKKEPTVENIVKNHRVFQLGGVLDLDIYLKLIKEWPALANIKFNIVADPTFTKENTGIGSIEYFSPLEEEYMVYPNGYKHKNPHKGEASIIYNPNDNDYEDIKMDLLHALRTLDPKYKALIEELDNAVLEGDDDLKRTAYERYANDRRLYGREYAPFINYVQNEVDGLLRNLFYNGDEKTLAAKNYYPNKKELIEWNKHLLPYILKIQNYLIGK